MWISIDVVQSGSSVIYLPLSLTVRLNTEVTISFGKKNIHAVVERAYGLEMGDGRDFDSPLKIRISSKLAQMLHIPPSPVYRMKYKKDSIIIGPVIGLLLGNRTHTYSPQHMIKYSDRFELYSKIGGLIFAFSPKAIDWENLLAYGLYYNHRRKAWEYGRFPLPTVIYRRDFHQDPDDIKRLIEITGGKVFNSWRFTKFYLYNYVVKDEELSKYLPPTKLTENFDMIKNFIDIHGKVILKPIGLSRGRGICIIRKAGDNYSIDDYRPRVPEKLNLNKTELEDFFRRNAMFFNRYIIQKFINLAKVDGGLFDIRIVMQKNGKAKWQLTGIECRVANKENLVTNISRGGYALSLDESLKRAFPLEDDCQTLKEQLYELCFKLCKYLDNTGHHFAEFGIDIAIDEDKNFWIIEVNVFPSFKGFKKMDYRTYLDIRYTPMDYASSLAGFSIKNVRGESDE